MKTQILKIRNQTNQGGENTENRILFARAETRVAIHYYEFAAILFFKTSLNSLSNVRECTAVSFDSRVIFGLNSVLFIY